MAAEKGDTVKGISLRRARRMRDNFGVKQFFGFRLKRRRTNRAGAYREAGAFFGDGTESRPVAAEGLHPAHHTVMLAVPAAAWGKIGVRIGCKDGRYEHPTEDQRKRKCDRAAHDQVNSIVRPLAS
jgi:hypothetical protein